MENLHFFFEHLVHMMQPIYLVVLFASSLLGIIFGALPGLTATLGVALLTTLTYGMDVDMALLSLIAIYMGGVFGGCYSSILLNIPGTSASAATAMEGFPMAMKGEAGQALGLANTASLFGGLMGMAAMIVASPMIATFALQFTSHEFLPAGTLWHCDFRHAHVERPCLQGMDRRAPGPCHGLRRTREPAGVPALYVRLHASRQRARGRADPHRRVRHSADHQRAGRQFRNHPHPPLQEGGAAIPVLFSQYRQGDPQRPDRHHRRRDSRDRRGHRRLDQLRDRQEQFQASREFRQGANRPG